MPQVIVGVGLPGIGKSPTLIKLADKQRAAYIDVGQVRARHKFGKLPRQVRNASVWRDIYSEIDYHLSNGRNVVINGANTSRMYRQDLVNFCRAKGASRIMAVVFHTSMAQARQRNERSKHPTSVHDLRQMAYHLRMEPPDRSEGFDAIAHRNI